MLHMWSQKWVVLFIRDIVLYCETNILHTFRILKFKHSILEFEKKKKLAKYVIFNHVDIYTALIGQLDPRM